MPFTLGGGDSLLSWWVIPCLGRVLARVPQVSLSLVALSTPDVVRRLEEGRLDFGLVRGKPPMGNLSSRTIGKLEYALFVPRKLRGRHKLTLETATTLPLAVQHGEPDKDVRQLRHWLGRDAGRSVLECETFPQVCRAIQTGEYAGLLPTIARGEVPDCDELEVPGTARMTVSVALAWHPRTEQARRSAPALADSLASVLAQKG
jgi:DNA-binding transcriptional LysR family regulator